MRTPLAWLVLSGLFLAGCSNPEQTRLYLQRELFESPQSQGKYILTGAIERMDSVASARSFRVLQAHAFSEGLAAVRMEGGWGYIDTTGHLCIPPLYEQAEDFVSGSAVVCRDTKWGLLGRRGEYILPPRFEAVTGFQDSLGFVRFEGQYHLVDLSLRQVLPLELKVKAARTFSEGLAAVKAGGKWGFVDYGGRVVIPCRYEAVQSFSDGLAAVEKSDRWGFIDRDGREVIETNYIEAGDFHEGLATVYLDSSRLGYKGVIIDSKGDLLIDERFYDAGYVSGGIIPFGSAIREKDRSVRVVWAYWKPRIDDVLTYPDFDNAMPFSEGFGAVEKDGKWGFVDSSGVLRTEISYDTVTSFYNNHSLVFKGGAWEILSTSDSVLKSGSNMGSAK